MASRDSRSGGHTQVHHHAVDGIQPDDKLAEMGVWTGWVLPLAAWGSPHLAVSGAMS